MKKMIYEKIEEQDKERFGQIDLEQSIKDITMKEILIKDIEDRSPLDNKSNNIYFDSNTKMFIVYTGSIRKTFETIEQALEYTHN